MAQPGVARAAVRIAQAGRVAFAAAVRGIGMDVGMRVVTEVRNRNVRFVRAVPSCRAPCHAQRHQHQQGQHDQAQQGTIETGQNFEE